MTYWENVTTVLAQTLPVALAFSLIALVPFVIAEKWRPATICPRWQRYRLNMMISLSTIILATPLGVAAGLVAQAFHSALGSQQLAIPFDRIEGIAGFGPVLKSVLMIMPLVLHDL